MNTFEEKCKIVFLSMKVLVFTSNEKKLHSSNTVQTTAKYRGHVWHHGLQPPDTMRGHEDSCQAEAAASLSPHRLVLVCRITLALYVSMRVVFRAAYLLKSSFHLQKSTEHCTMSDLQCLCKGPQMLRPKKEIELIIHPQNSRSCLTL